MLERICLLFEIVAALLVLWALHGSKKRPGICTILYVCLELIIISMIGEGWISSKYAIFAYMGIAIIDFIEFDDTIKKAIMYMVVDSVVMFALQALGAIVILQILGKDEISLFETIVVNAFLLCVIIFLFIKCNVELYISSFFEMKYVIDSILVILAIILLVIIKHESFRTPLDWNLIIFLIIFFFSTILVSIKLVGERIQKNKFIEQIQQYEQYNSVYKELISDIRHKQHDFDNHLQALYSMSMSCGTIEELQKEQKEYLEGLQENKNSYYLLRENVSSVLTAFLYVKMKEIEEKGINVYYHIHIDKLEKMIPFFDIVELVGNLLDNATEATMQISNKIVHFEIDEKESDVRFILINSYDWVEGENFDRFMIDGKSSKGNNRGFGLTNVNEIVERYHGIMQVQFEYEQDIKVIRFEIVLPITKEGR